MKTTYPAGLVLTVALVACAAGAFSATAAPMPGIDTVSGCTPAQGQQVVQDVKVVDGVLTTVCKALEQQPEPAFVTFACDVVDVTGQVVNSFGVKVAKEKATAFAAAHAKK
jgi:molybdopterin-guanine dinucleotide biosynthesis protein A